MLRNGILDHLLDIYLMQETAIVVVPTYISTTAYVSWKYHKISLVYEYYRFILQ
jgi:hypothetical protein